MTRTSALPLLGTALALLAADPASAQQVIRTGQTVSGTLSASDPTLQDGSHFDLYQFNGQPGQRITVVMRSTDFDAFLAGGPVGGQLADSDDDGAGGTDAQLTVTLPANGRYSIRANSLEAGSTGAYTISVQAQGGGGAGSNGGGQAPRPAPGGGSQPGTITAGQTVSGSLAASDPVLPDDSHYDLYVYRGTAGERIAVTLRSTAFDAFLTGGTLSRGVLTPTASDDDSGGGRDARFETEVPAGGELAIRVNSLAAGETGAYQLSVQRTAASTRGQAGAGTPIRAGQEVRGQLAASDPRLSDNSYYKLYTYTGQPGEEIEVTMTSSAFDTYLGGGATPDLALAGGEVDDDGAGGTNSRLRVQLGPTGRYVIRANSLAAGQTGAFTLSVRSAGAASDNGGELASLPAVRMGQTVQGRLANTDPKMNDGSYFQAYRYQGSPGDEIVVTLSSPDFDPYMSVARMFGGELERVANDDDSGPGNAARVRARLDQRGTYVIVANSFAADQTGRYTLAVQAADQVADEAEAASSTMATIRTGQPVAGRLERTDRVLADTSYADLYVYRGSPGDQVQVTLRSSDFDSFLSIGTTDGEDVRLLGSDDDGAGGRDAQMRFTVDGSGLYAIQANSYGPRQTGAYTLTVERVSGGAQAPTLGGSGGSRAPTAGGGNRANFQGKWLTDYPAVRSPQFSGLRTEAMREQRLEGLAGQLNANYPLPRNIPLVYGECGFINAFYDPNEGSVTFCYEMMQYLQQTFSQSAQSQQALSEAVNGAFSFIMMHEVGHALVHQLDLPITGREEDAADQLAALILLQEGDKGANAALAGALALQDGDNSFDDSDFADEHSLGPQRLYNVACWIYGSDPQKYRAWVTGGMLPEARAVRCPSEYEQMAKSWTRLLGSQYGN